MLKIIRDYPQGSDEWFSARLGNIGGTGISKIVTSTGKRASPRKQYMYQLAAEKITGKKTETYCSKDMQNGIDREPQTRMAFQVETWKEVDQVAGLVNTDLDGVFVSPDGLIVGEEAGLELKSVIPATQVKYLDKGVCPTEYKLQCQISMFVTGWETWWFCSHCPGLPLFYLPVKRDDELIRIIDNEINIFIHELGALVESLRA